MGVSQNMSHKAHLARCKRAAGRNGTENTNKRNRVCASLSRARERPPTLSHLGIRHRVALLGIAERGLDVFVAKALADGRQAHPVLNQGGRVAVAELVQGAVNADLGAVGCPSRLDGLVAQRLAVTVLQRPEQWPVPRLRLLHVAPEQVHEFRVVEQHRAAMSALAEDIEVLIVVGQVEIVHIKRERLADAQAGLGEQPKEQLVTEMVMRDDLQHRINLVPRDPARPWLRHLHAVERDERVRVEQVVFDRPGEEAVERGHGAGTARRAPAVAAGERCTYHVDGDRPHGSSVAGDEVIQLRPIGP